MRKIIVLLLIVSCFTDYSYCQTAAEKTQIVADGMKVGFNIFNRWGKNRRTKKAKKELKKMQQRNEECVECWNVNNYGNLDLDYECQKECRKMIQEQKNEQTRMAREQTNATLNAQIAQAAAEKERIRAAEEAKRQAELARQEAERKAAEERKNAIQKLETTKIGVYSFDETTLSESQKSELDVIADILNKYSDIKVLIVGHTCDIGYKSINQRKGLKRAETGKEYLIEKGISSERISVDSKGETEPLIYNTSNENRKQNRRIEFVIE